MSVPTFDELITNDVKDVFLIEFSQKVIYSSGTNVKTIVIQFFEEPLDKMGTQYYHAWCANDDLPYIKNGDTLEIEAIVYAVVDFSPDEFQSGLNLFLQKV